MAQITAAMVKELRERTGAGMMDCKRALTETDGDMDVAIDAMRKSGAAKAIKKAGRVAAEGQVAICVADDKKKVSIVEINSETDFVAKDENFQGFADEVAKLILESGKTDVEAISALVTKTGGTVEEARQALVSKVGENIQLRRAQIIAAGEGGTVAAYRHGMRIGVVLALSTGETALGKDVAMHIAATRPVCIDETEVPKELLEKEKEIFSAQAAESGKPPEIIEKMVSGRMRKYLGEITLLGQAFVKDPDQTVGKLLKGSNSVVDSFVCFEVGEGIEKKKDDFAAEVMAAAKG